MWSVGRIDLPKMINYVIAQLVGATLAIVAIKFFYPDMAGQIGVYGAPHLASDVTPMQGVLIEAILTFLLAFTVMGTCVDDRAPKMGGLFVGLIVMVDILAGGVMTGAAMNPARAFAPMIVANQYNGFAIYWVGPILGSVLAMQLYERLFLKKDG